MIYVRLFSEQKLLLHISPSFVLSSVLGLISSEQHIIVTSHVRHGV